MTYREAILETAADTLDAIRSMSRPTLILGAVAILFVAPLVLVARSAGLL